MDGDIYYGNYRLPLFLFSVKLLRVLACLLIKDDTSVRIIFNPYPRATLRNLTVLVLIGRPGLHEHRK